MVLTGSASSRPPEASGERVVWAEVWLRSASSWCSLDLHAQSPWKFQEKLFHSRVSRGWDLQVAVFRMPSRALSWMSVQNNQLLQNKQKYFLVNIVISLVCFLMQVGPRVEVLWHKLVMKVWSFLWTELWIVCTTLYLALLAKLYFTFIYRHVITSVPVVYAKLYSTVYTRLYLTLHSKRHSALYYTTSCYIKLCMLMCGIGCTKLCSVVYNLLQLFCTEILIRAVGLLMYYYIYDSVTIV